MTYLVLQTYMPYIVDLTIYKYDFEHIKHISKDIQFLELITYRPSQNHLVS